MIGNQIVVGITYLLAQASDKATTFQEWASQKAEGVGIKLPTTVLPSFMRPINNEIDNDKKEVATCPLESSVFSTSSIDLSPPSTEISAIEANRELLEEVLAAIPPTFTGRFDQLKAAQAEDLNKLNEETQRVTPRIRF
jgi:hypothetical protein